MDVTEAGRKLQESAPMEGGVITCHCNRCAWGITIPIYDTVICADEIFNRHYCADYEAK